MNYTELIKKLDNYLKLNLTPKRYNHSLNVAKMCTIIASQIQINKERVYYAGLAHDIAREYSFDKLKKAIISCNGFSSEFYNKPILFHGPVGANILSNKFNIYDKEIINAVAYHTIGNEKLGVIGKIVYVSDYISLDRIHITDLYRSEILSLSLDEMVIKVTDSCRIYLESKGGCLLPETENMYNEILRIICEKEKRF